MTITITLPPTMEQRLRAQSEATGKDIAALVVEAVEARLGLAELGLREILAPIHEDFRQSGMSESQLETLLEETLAEARAERKQRSGLSS